MPEQQHVCPYAAALSDDEDASHHSSGVPSGSANSPKGIAEEALAAARQKCPAFQNNACPFRAATDPDAVREVMKQVPPSHFPTRNGALQGALRGNNNAGGEGGEGAAGHFRLAMEHVHRVSSWLEHGQNTNAAAQNEGGGSPNTSSNSGGARRNSLTAKDREHFVLRGGCPFKQFHHGRSFDDKATHLARAMEDFSLAAIMGRMAEESFYGEEGLELEDEGKVEDEGEITEREESASAASEDEQQKQPASAANIGEGEEEWLPLLSQALKTGTAESHTAAENVHFVNNFIKGDIDRDLYAEMVSGLYHTYVALEKLLDAHAPKEFPTLHFPEELGRTATLEEDMEFWHGLGWETKPECKTPSPAVKDYVDRMEEIGKIDPLLLLSHAYTRYLGDLSGGKVLSPVARRALHLDGYDGLQFYKFDRVKSAKLFKDQYRQALDELELTPSHVGKLVAEANVAFALNMRVFEELDVRGGVPGARVRDVREALAYYDIEVEHQEKEGRPRSGSVAAEEEAKCPFGFKGGPNPHKAPGTGNASANAAGDAQEAAKEPTAVPTKSDVVAKKEHATEGGRCPWPFVVFHDPATFMKDWQTWFVVGLLLCWCWSQIK
ncbi:hypothetical protein ACHAXT_009511 [Thalassiosira profunda]